MHPAQGRLAASPVARRRARRVTLHLLAPSAFAVVASGAAAIPAGAQQWRSVDVSRQLQDSGLHVVRVRYGAGTLAIAPGDDPLLFAMHLRYDEAAVTPVHRYDADGRTLTLGLSDPSLHLGRSVGKRTEGELRIALSREVPISLDVDVGAARATLDLGGIALRDARIRTGASDARIAFATPNPEAMETLDISAGAAAIAVTGLSNANAAEVSVDAGVGQVSIDFGGALRRDVTIDAEMALGRVEVRVPRDAGVRVELERVLAGFSHFGLVKRGDAWYSENWDRAPRHVTIRARTVFGSIAITRAE